MRLSVTWGRLKGTQSAALGDLGFFSQDGKLNQVRLSLSKPASLNFVFTLRQAQGDLGGGSG
jgi:hypothetical protein